MKRLIVLFASGILLVGNHLFSQYKPVTLTATESDVEIYILKSHKNYLFYFSDDAAARDTSNFILAGKGSVNVKLYPTDQLILAKKAGYHPLYFTVPYERYFAREIKIPALEKYPSKESRMTEVRVAEIHLKMKTGDTSSYVFANRLKMEENLYNSVTINQRETSAYLSEIRYKVNSLLKEIGYMDTTQSMDPIRNDLLEINFEITNFKSKKLIYGGYTRVMDVKMTISNYYGKELYSEALNLVNSSGHDKDDMNQIIYDVLYPKVLQFLKSKEYQEVSQKAIQSDGYEERLLLAPPAATVTSVQKAIPSIVTIKTDDGTGSGVIISDDGYLVTNLHVCSTNDTVKVILKNEKELPAQVIRISGKSDLALLKFLEMPDTIYAIKPQVNPPLEYASTVFAIGTPSDIKLSQSITRGIISNLSEFDGVTFIQTDAKINPGNSGGALLNDKGELIGITNAKLVGIGIEGLGFAILSRHIYSDLNIDYK